MLQFGVDRIEKPFAVVSWELLVGNCHEVRCVVVRLIEVLYVQSGDPSPGRFNEYSDAPGSCSLYRDLPLEFVRLSVFSSSWFATIVEVSMSVLLITGCGTYRFQETLVDEKIVKVQGF